MDKHKFLYFILLPLLSVLMFLPLLFRAQFEHVKSFGLFGILLVNFISSATIFVPTPGILSVGVGGSLYNPLLVAIAASLGSSFGELVTFGFGRSSKKVLNLKRIPFFPSLKNEFIRKSGPLLVFIFSFIPNPFFDGIGLLVGISSFSLVQFLGLVFAGRLLRNLIVAYVSSFL